MVPSVTKHDFWSLCKASSDWRNVGRVREGMAVAVVRAARVMLKMAAAGLGRLFEVGSGRIPGTVARCQDGRAGVIM